MDDNVVAALAVTLIFGAPCAVWLVTRILAHHERMEMLRRGFTPPPDSKDWHRAMRRGWVPPPPQGGAPYDFSAHYAAQYQLRRGIQIAFVGLALVIGLGFIGYRGGVVYPGPWLLGGLIPMFVGIAQVVSALAAGASFGAPVPQQRMAPPGPAAAPGAARDTSGGWRPGSLPEIEPPVSPPDRR